MLIGLTLPAFIIGLAFGETEWARASGRSRLETRAARLDSEESDWRLEALAADHNAGLPSDDRNAAREITDIVRGFPQSDASTESAWTWLGRALAGRPPNERVSETIWLELESRFAVYRPGLNRMARLDGSAPSGLELEYAGGDPGAMRVDSAHEVRTAISAREWESLRAAHSGETDRALAISTAGLRLLRSIAFQPVLIAYLARVGAGANCLNSIQQTLAWCREPSDAALASTQEAIESECAPLPLRPALRAERAIIVTAIEMTERGELNTPVFLAFRRPSSRKEQARDWYARRFLPSHAAYVLERFDEWFAWLDRPDWERVAALDGWPPPTMSRGEIFGRHAIAPVAAAGTVDVRHKSHAFVARAGVACERYRLKYKRWPAALGDLAEFGIAPEKLIDPFDGSRLRYRSVDDGVVVYSVGRDRIDDGGIALRDRPAPDDIAFRLWNPASRRIAPKDR